MSTPFPKNPERTASVQKTSMSARGKDEHISALSKADAVVEQHANKSIADNTLAQHRRLKNRSARVPHRPTVERELAELKKVVAALAVRSIAHDGKTVAIDAEGMTLLDANTAHQLLDDPAAPTEALRNLLALR